MSEDDAYADLAVLDAQGVIAYVLVNKGKGGDGSIRLRVPQSNAARALELLGPEPATFPQPSWDDPDGDYACPRCRSTRSRALPPYAMIAGFIVVASLPWLFAREQWLWGGAVALGWLVGSRLLRSRIMHWRCLNCGHAWNHNVERRRRDDARRAAPE